MTWLQPKSMALYECSNQIICNKHILLPFSIEDIQYYVLFNIIAGPEAVLCQPLEDTKVFECPEVLEFNQVRGAPEYS